MNNNKSNVGLMHYYMRVVWRLHGGRLILLFGRRWPIVVVVVIRTNNNSNSRLVVSTIVTVPQSRMERKNSLLKLPIITTMGEDEIVPVV
jgi:hypothetical protein